MKIKELSDFYIATINAPGGFYRQIFVKIPKINQVQSIALRHYSTTNLDPHFNGNRTTLEKIKTNYWSCPVNIEPISLQEVSELCPGALDLVIDVPKTTTSIRRLEFSNQLPKNLFKYHLDWERSQHFGTHDLLKCNCWTCERELEMSPVYSVRFFGREIEEKIFGFVFLVGRKFIRVN